MWWQRRRRLQQAVLARARSIGTHHHHHHHHHQHQQAAAATALKPVLLDRFNRFHKYVRISLTERCNLRCQYCMPEDGVELTADSKLMVVQEVERIARVFVRNGVTKVRLTGGEPLIRRDLEGIVAALNALRPAGLEEIGITTNAITLSRRLPSLVQAGLDAVNISLDTLDPHRFQLITRRRGHERVMKAIQDAQESGLRSVKVNCVVMKGMNEDEILDFVRLTQQQAIEVRFIEYMPFDGNKWNSAKMMTYLEMRSLVEQQFPDLQRLSNRPSDTSKVFQVPGFRGTVGFITSMTENFCAGCNRLRVTADGNLKVCLFGQSEVSLRDAMRRGDSDAALNELISAAVKRKKARHADEEKERHQSGLSHIGGDRLPRMVYVGDKSPSRRTALAQSRILLPEKVSAAINADGELVAAKGPVFATAIIAGTMAVKKTGDLIPFCHPLAIEGCNLTVQPSDDKRELLVQCRVSVSGKTGVEMEALTGASVAALTIYDMCKALSHDIVIAETKLLCKFGGKSGSINLHRNSR